ncbi:B3 domain-containing transcription factor VRN1 [Linum perenne]
MAPLKRKANGRRNCSHQQKNPNSQLPPSSYSSYMADPYQGFFHIVGRSALEQGIMMLPVEFVREYGEELSDSAKVSAPYGGLSWKLGFTKSSKDRVCFDDGFDHFMRYHSVDYGYCLAFTYKGMSCFKVRIYKADGFEISYHPRERTENGNSDADCCNADDDEQPPVVLRSKRARPKKRKEPSSPHKTPVAREEEPEPEPDVVLRSKRGRGLRGRRKSASSSPKMTVIKEEEELEDTVTGQDEEDKLLEKRLEEMEMVTNARFLSTVASLSPGRKKALYEASLMKPKNPAFLVVMKATDLNQGRLYLPSCFVSKHMQNAPRGSIKIQPSDGMEAGQEGWSLGAYDVNNGGAMFATGCWDFYRDNHLEAGDVCVFELVSSMEAALKVSIVHAA